MRHSCRSTRTYLICPCPCSQVNRVRRSAQRFTRPSRPAHTLISVPPQRQWDVLSVPHTRRDRPRPPCTTGCTPNTSSCTTTLGGTVMKSCDGEKMWSTRFVPLRCCCSLSATPPWHPTEGCLRDRHDLSARGRADRAQSGRCPARGPGALRPRCVDRRERLRPSARTGSLRPQPK